jgi:prepilin-type N-terminal cleavage/methylation domain-containing protein
MRDEWGFTLIEVMIAIVLMCVGLVVAAGSFPSLMAASLYGKDQTRAANLAQQQLEVYRNTSVSNLASLVGDYGSKVTSTYFDQNGNPVTSSSAAYFTRDVQVQYWTWVTSTSQFSLPASPYVTPSSGTSYIYRITVAAHWLVRGHNVYTASGTTKGCVVSNTAVAVGQGCITVSSFAAP